MNGSNTIIRTGLVLAASLSLGLGASVRADCDPGSKRLFTCQTRHNGKRIEVCDDGKTIRYSFGRDKQPEILLKVPRDQASSYQWSGFGRAMTYSVNIPNGRFEYRVFAGAEKDATEGYAGVNVVKDGEQIATVECDPKRVEEHLQGLDLKRAEEW